MLKKSIAIGVLCFAGHASANIVVNTTADEVKNDESCSLREAVQYVNMGMPEGGYNGCVVESNTPSILLEENETYVLNQQITIEKALRIATEANTNIADNTIGLRNATIKANGKHRLFQVDDGKANIDQIAVTLEELNLEGCGVASCATQGGLIFNRENLTLSYTKLEKGYASAAGGAIYNAGLMAAGSTRSAGQVQVVNSLLKDNVAKQGAAVYSEHPRFGINRSVLRNNTATDANGYILYTQEDITGEVSNGYNPYILNSSIFSNQGRIANIRSTMRVNNVTAIRNTAGFYFEAYDEDAFGSNVGSVMSNSIVAENTSFDCRFANNDLNQQFTNLTSSSCGQGDENNKNIFLASNQKLIAGSQIDGSCDLPPADGLLCPYNKREDDFLGYFKPRLLTSYSSLKDSPLINRGTYYSDGQQQGLAVSCEQVDQRGLSRSQFPLCDIGSIQLIANPSDADRIGADLKYGEIAEISLSDAIGDGDLLPANQCAAVLGSANDPDGNPWKVGCVRIVQNEATVANSKGTTTVAANGDVVYRPSSNYHGSDQFYIKVVTTASRFADALNDRSIDVYTVITQEPAKGIDDSTTDIPIPNDGKSSGSFGFGGLIGLLALALFRRKMRVATKLE